MTNALTLRELLPGWRDDLSELAPLAAKKLLRLFGDRETQLTAAQTEMRFAFGVLLLHIQQERMFESQHLGGYKDWSTFMDKGIPDLTGGQLKTASAWFAISLAQSKTFKKLPPEERGKIPLSNARTIVKLEKSGSEAVTPEVVHNGQSMAPGTFSASVGAARGIVVKAVVFDKEAAVHIQRILDQLKPLSAGAAEAFANFLESANLVGYAGNGVDDRVEAVLGHVTTSMVKDLVFEAEAQASR